MAKATHTLFITPQYLIDNSAINENVEHKILNKSIRTASDKYLMPIIGSPLYEALIGMITGNTLTGSYQQLMDDYIVPCLIEYATYEYIPKNYKFKNKGIQKQSSPDSQAVDLAELSYIKEDVLDSAQFYAERLIKHLKANMQTYPEYAQYRSIEDVPPAKSDWFSGIHFPGMNRGNDNSFGKGFTTNIDF